MKLDLRRLRHILMVAETGSFSRAAELLAITQPALSRSIATLEEEFGLRIFDRGRAGVFITPVGAVLIGDARKLLTQAQGVEHNLRQLSAGEAGTVSFGMSPMVASIFLPRLLARVTAVAPKLVLIPKIIKADGLITKLAQGELEACYLAEALLPPFDTVVTRISPKVRFGVFARAGHPLAGQAGIGTGALGGFPFAASQAEIPARPDKPPFQVTVVCENYLLMKELMLMSDTICLTSALLLDAELASGKVVELDTGLMSSNSFDLCLVQLAGRTPSPGARLLIQAFGEVAGLQGQLPPVASAVTSG